MIWRISLIGTLIWMTLLKNKIRRRLRKYLSKKYLLIKQQSNILRKIILNKLKSSIKKLKKSLKMSLKKLMKLL